MYTYWEVVRGLISFTYAASILHHYASVVFEKKNIYLNVQKNVRSILKYSITIDLCALNNKDLSACTELI
jgi:hypothetical protein